MTVSWPRWTMARPMQPTFITHEWVRVINGTHLPASASTICGTPMPLTCWRLVSIRRLPANGSGTPRSGLPWTFKPRHAGDAGGRRREDGCGAEGGPAEALGSLGVR